MKEQIIRDASLEALSKKSFKKYLKMLIKGKRKYLCNFHLNAVNPYFDRTHAEYNILCQVLDDYKYYQARKGDSCRI